MGGEGPRFLRGGGTGRSSSTKARPLDVINIAKAHLRCNAALRGLSPRSAVACGRACVLPGECIGRVSCASERKGLGVRGSSRRLPCCRLPCCSRRRRGRWWRGAGLVASLLHACRLGPVCAKRGTGQWRALMAGLKGASVAPSFKEPSGRNVRQGCARVHLPAGRLRLLGQARQAAGGQGTHVVVGPGVASAHATLARNNDKAGKCNLTQVSCLLRSVLALVGCAGATTLRRLALEANAFGGELD